ncbi:hypothetical protein ASPACDRAFT_40742 [Aspergillus aculeatus ATCC 16872]|uniref:Myb-like transcription factor n=1 Tax=Aspergillus aculeatus (strain ATCC 16872 / CBS 172.66 / WB 5094) TaxID=690307 RepID=A0A1L9X076_ASPA1|nr:uncharacterized protein ASPACDRAFT_40742 [Aspergillus aculeatus ATCC 16872]OJK01925.1 hypothetical protein ASPACDRAFT_40742 [Aspergillus aculeatus ATCC 16872]
MKRSRRSWTTKEDELLRKLVQNCGCMENSSHNSFPHLASSRTLILSSATALDTSDTVLWSELAQKVPGRSNKDCRKRWWNTLAGGNIKGVWSPEEDKRLSEAVREHGNNWTQIATLVGSRCADQCSSHWRQVLRPNDEELLKAVQTHGTNWSAISAFHNPPRTGLSLKNRYTRIRVKEERAGPSVLSKGPPAPGDRRNRVVKLGRKRSFPQRGITPDCDEQLREGRTSDECPDSPDAPREYLHPIELKPPASWSIRSPNNASSNCRETSTPWVGHGTIDPRLILPCPFSTEDCRVDSTPNLTVSAIGGSWLPSFDRVLDATQAENDWDRQVLLLPRDAYPTDNSFRTVHEALYLAPDPCSLRSSRHSSTEPLHPFLTMTELDLMPREPSLRASVPSGSCEKTAETNMHRVSLDLSCTTSQFSSIMSRVADTGAVVNMTVDTE